MEIIKLSTISHVVKIKMKEGLRGGAYYNVIVGDKTVRIYPHVSGWREQSAAVYHDGKIDVVVGEDCYEGWSCDGGPRVSMSSEARPAVELYNEIGFGIDVDA